MPKLSVQTIVHVEFIHEFNGADHDDEMDYVEEAEEMAVEALDAAGFDRFALGSISNMVSWSDE